MYIKKYWGNYIGGTDDSLNLVAFLAEVCKILCLSGPGRGREKSLPLVL